MIATYCLSYGNNAWAIAMWRNSMVFHSLDKVTSLFIHIMPPVVLHCLVDSLDPFSEGILFSVMPPKKSWKNISNLSGGEKTLSSLALVFALHHYKPTPLYVMDEIDAALDFRNVSIVASYIKERTKNAPQAQTCCCGERKQ